jgi:predicted DsbA family dithiol-disulfide isomerase
VSAAPAAVRIRHFTDPACPFAFSAERQRLRLEWLYGDQIAWELHMVVLREEREEEWTYSEVYRGLQLLYGMPIDWRKRLWHAASIHACRAVVATRLRWPDREAALLRRLRVLGMGGALLDDSDTLEQAAAEAGLPVAELAAYCAADEVEAALRADMAAARAPSPASLAQDYKLGGPARARRYTCPSYEMLREAGPHPAWETAARVDLPGFRPIEAYETALANLAPELVRRSDPDSVLEVLAWAGIPLATVEVAAVCDREVPDVRAELARVARFAPVGGDGYWSAE